MTLPEYLYEYFPTVIICPSRGKLALKGKTLNVQQVGGRKSSAKSKSKQAPSAEVIESQISGDFEGWEGETIVKLMNGQIWQQTEYRYRYHYAFMPKVLIYPSASGYKMKIEGIEESVGVVQLK